MSDDTHLIDELQDRIHEHAATIDIPNGLAAEIRGRARRRTARRAIAAGVPVLAAAAVTALAVSAPGAHTARLTTSPAHRSAAAAGAGPGHALDTAYIVRRARAQLASVTDGVLASTGPMFENWFYVDPSSQVQYQRTVNIEGGTTSSWTAMTATPIDHVLHFHAVSVLVQPASDGRSASDVIPGHTWSVSDSVASSPEQAGNGQMPPGNIDSDGAQIRQALSSGQVHQDGTGTVDGTPAIKLALPASSGTTSNLYVDARTDAPLEEVDVHALTPSGTSTTTERWLPATPANIALAKAQPIPAGYTQTPAQG